MFEPPEERAAKTWNLMIELWGGDDDDPAPIGKGRATVIDLDDARRCGFRRFSYSDSGRFRTAIPEVFVHA
jgi:hypothetical protein